MSPQPGLRIGDDDREAAITALGEHYAAGRLTKEEYDERAGRALAARTSADLGPLFADLPRRQSARPAARAGRPGPGRRPGRPGWWFGAALVPVLMVVGLLFVLTHLPLILLLVIGVVLFAKAGRHRAGRGYRHDHWQGRHDWVR